MMTLRAGVEKLFPDNTLDVRPKGVLTRCHRIFPYLVNQHVVQCSSEMSEPYAVSMEVQKLFTAISVCHDCFYEIMKNRKLWEAVWSKGLMAFCVQRKP